MKISTFKFFPAFILSFLLFQGSQNLSAQSVSLTGDEGDVTFLKDKDQWVELTELRTINSRSFRKPDGNIIVQSSAEPLCFKSKDGSILPLDLTLYAPGGGGWKTRAQTNPSWLHADGSVSFTKDDNWIFRFHKNLKLNGTSLSFMPPLVNGNGYTIDFQNMDMDQLGSFNENRIKSAFIVYSLSQDQAGKVLLFSEEISVQEGFTLKEDKGNGRRLPDGSWEGDLVIISALGEEMGRMHRPEYYDSHPQQPSQIVGSYILQKIGDGNYQVETVVPKQWVNDPARIFPLVIDPLLTGPTALWGGGNMPSCSFPTYNRDSILVTIPGTITITGFMVQSSYEAAVATNTPKSDGRMYFSTNCGFSPVLTVTGPQGALPGTAYLPWSNYRAYLACCLSPSCNPQQIWVRMHLSRVNNAPACNQNYIYYNQFSAWPFSVYCEGRTLESYGQFWTVNPPSICSNVCTINANVFARHGVPPYTVTHPWASGPVTMGNPNPCSYNQTNIPIMLTIPGCPTYCGNISALNIPPPTITDACGNTAAGLGTKTVNILPAPNVVATPNPLAVCPGEPVIIQFTSCLPNTTYSWMDDQGNTGLGDILTVHQNSTTVPDTILYTVLPTGLNGCTGTMVNIPVVVNPYPGANAGTDTTIESGTTIILNGQGGNGNATYTWTPAYNLSCTNCPNPNAWPSTTTTYILEVTENGCVSYDTITIFVEVAPVGIFVPNTFSPNGDGINDILQPGMLGIASLEMHIFNRWGELIYSWNTLSGGWDGMYKNDIVQEDAYVWMLKAYPEDLHHPPIEMQGTVNVIGKGKRF